MEHRRYWRIDYQNGDRCNGKDIAFSESQITNPERGNQKRIASYSNDGAWSGRKKISFGEGGKDQNDTNKFVCCVSVWIARKLLVLSVYNLIKKVNWKQTTVVIKKEHKRSKFAKGAKFDMTPTKGNAASL